MTARLTDAVWQSDRRPSPCSRCGGLSLSLSLDTHETEGYVAPSAFTHPGNCSSGDVAYDQTGSPYPVRLPDLTEDVLTGNGPPCLSTGPWVQTHLDYWDLFLNGIFWTYLIYGLVLIPAHAIKWSTSKLCVMG